VDFAYSDEQKLLRDNIVGFARRELNQDVVARDRDEAFRRDLWQKCAALGVMGLPVPESYGGSGLDALTCAIALEALGYGTRDSGLVFSISAHLLACVVPIMVHGDDLLKQKYLPGLVDGSLIGMHAITEPGSGSDSFAMRSTARRDGADWILNGTKTFVSNGPVGDVCVTFALADSAKGYHGGVTAFVIDRGTTGFSSGQKFEKMGLRTSAVSELVLDDVRVSSEAVLGEVGGGAAVFATAMEWERVLLVAGHVGTMERLLDTCVAYARTRSQFGQPIGKFQAVAHKIADMKVRLEASRSLLYRTAWRLGRHRAISLDASIVKLFVSESLVQVALDAVQVHGGNGYMTEFEVERALRDAVGGTIYSGTSEMQRNLIARWLGL
jgi:alkylation response protein AidB-like acyl-CoA dehydrogenase